MSVASGRESDLTAVFSFESLYRAYLGCRRRKRNTIDALGFEADLLENLLALSETLATGSYAPSRSLCFVVSYPKLREVFAAHFRDRVVHHLLVPRLEQVFEPRFIFDSYACRKEKGTHKAVSRLQEFMSRSSRNGQRPAWFLQLDVKGFFMSIDKGILFSLLARKVQDPTLLGLCRIFLDHNCTQSYLLKSPRTLLAQVPPHKTLFHAPPGKGLPIGNLTSQFFANLYLDRLDQFVKHKLKAPYYIRYMDDFVLVSPEQEQLLTWKAQIETFLKDHLALELRPESVLNRVSQGADFLGYIVRPDYLLVRRRVITNLKEKLLEWQARLVSRFQTPRGVWGRLACTPEQAIQLTQTLASYLGHFKQADSYRLTQSLWERFGWLQALVSWEPKTGLVPRYQPPFSAGNLNAQVGWFRRRYPGYLIFFQLGRFFEFFGKQAREIGPRLGLAANRTRKGLGTVSGFPCNLVEVYQRQVLDLGLGLVIVRENGFCASGLKQRMATEIFTYLEEGR